MKIIGNSINAAVLIISWLIYLCSWSVEWFGHILERRLVAVSFGAGPRTAADWLQVAALYTAVYFLLMAL